ncbi:MAG TPA: ATP-binding protein, partial [Chitinophagaceae bacterium]|nr:ATP-binding protein [Chitinophagaceae bacterium]
TSIINDKHGKFYISGIGFYILDSLNGNLSEYRPHTDRSDGSSINADTLTTSYMDKAGNIWLGTLGGGLNLFNPKTNSFKYYLQGLKVFTVYEDTKGTIWTGTDHGLYNKNKDSGSFSPFANKETPLQNGNITGLIEDNDGNIWGSSPSLGLFRINPLKQEVCIYGKKFGTADFWGEKNDAWKTTDGKLFFGSVIGYYSFFPRQVMNYTPPVILLTGLKLNGKSVTEIKNNLLNGSIEQATEISLQHNQNIFSIDFAAIHYTDPENNILQYMLEGYETEWRKAEQLKTAYYFNVPPGHYTFRVKGSSSYGLLSEKAIKITVLPPWWQTWWAYILYALLLIGLIWSFIKWRTRALKKEKIVLEEKVIERTKELKEEKELVESTLSELKSTQAQLIQSEKMASLGELTAGIAHEIQNPLNFVNNFSEVSNELIDEMKTELENNNKEDAIAIALDVKQNLEKILQHGKRADAIVKGMLQHSRSSTGIKEPTDINALADEYLRLAYHGLRAKDKNFNATMQTDFDESIGKVNVIPQDIGRVILNLITNAFYTVTEKKKQLGDEYDPIVSVSTKKVNRKVEISVKDNGNGIPQKVLDKIFQPFFTTKPTGQGTGLGLSLSYDIIKAHGGEIKVRTNENEGTEFCISLPL